MLLEAFAIARADGLDATLEIVGTGPERVPLSEQRDRLGLVAAVAFIEPLPRDALHERIAAAHALVVPSRHEGLGLVAVEALALRRPVIASRVGGLVEVVAPGSGVLVPPEDASALAAALPRAPSSQSAVSGARGSAARSSRCRRRAIARSTSAPSRAHSATS